MARHRHPLGIFLPFILVMSAVLDLVLDPVSAQRISGVVTNAGKKPVNVVLLLPNDSTYMFSYTQVAPALEIALEKLRANNSLLTTHYLDVRYSDTMCNEAYGMNYAIEYFIKRQVDVFFGPICDYVVAPILRQCTFWNLPMITIGATAGDFVRYRKSMYPMLTRVGPVNHYSLVNFFITQVRMYKWRKIKMLYDKDGQDNIVNDFCHFTNDVLINMLRSMKDVVDEVGLWKFSANDDFGRMLLDEVSLDYGVLVLCASPHSVREIMIKAHELEFDNGEYVFFNIDLFTSKNSSERPWYNATDTDDRNDKARKAYEALMTVTLRKPTNQKYREFSQDVKKRAQKLYKNFTYGEDEVNSFVGAFHDAVILYAIALNESLAANVSISNGSEITRRMWNKTFTGITGNVSIDENGDRNADYSLLDMDPKTSEFRVVANYYGNRKQYEPVNGVQIHWAGGRSEPPPDTPECGFDGSKCPPEEPFPLYVIVIIVLGSVIIVVLIISFFVYRRNGALRVPDADTCDLQRT